MRYSLFHLRIGRARSPAPNPFSGPNQDDYNSGPSEQADFQVRTHLFLPVSCMPTAAVLSALDIGCLSPFIQHALIKSRNLLLIATKACDLCREKRVRCQLGSVDAPHKPPGARCWRGNRGYRFSATRKRRPKRAALPLHGNILLQSPPTENFATTTTTDGL